MESKIQDQDIPIRIRPECRERFLVDVYETNTHGEYTERRLVRTIARAVNYGIAPNGAGFHYVMYQGRAYQVHENSYYPRMFIRIYCVNPKYGLDQYEKIIVCPRVPHQPNKRMKTMSYPATRAGYMNAISVNMWQGNVWGVTPDGKRTLLKSVYN